MVAFMHTGTRLTAGYRYTTLGDATVFSQSIVTGVANRPSRSVNPVPGKSLVVGNADIL